MSDIRELEAALGLTETMLNAARAEDWERVAELETRRQACVQAAFAAPVGAADAPVVAGLARQILALDGELVSRGEGGLLTLSEALRKVQVGRRAQKAYAAGLG
jgi:hypothetical protein